MAKAKAKMAKHKAVISRWVCESVEIEIEAESPQAALTQAAKLYNAGDTDDLDWKQDAYAGCRDTTLSVGDEFLDLDEDDEEDEDEDEEED